MRVPHTISAGGVEVNLVTDLTRWMSTVHAARALQIKNFVLFSLNRLELVKAYYHDHLINQKKNISNFMKNCKDTL